MYKRQESAIEQLDGRHGWKLVPVEPTEAMENEAHGTEDDPVQVSRFEIWEAMLAAAPDPLAEDKP